MIFTLIMVTEGGFEHDVSSGLTVRSQLWLKQNGEIEKLPDGSRSK